jgi:hypothetical protein
MAASVNHLTAQDLINLPKNFGVGRPVVPHIVTLRFRKKSTTLDCGTWDDLTEVAPPPRDPQAAAWSRFIALALVIENMTKDAKAAAKDKKRPVIRQGQAKGEQVKGSIQGIMAE